MGTPLSPTQDVRCTARHPSDPFRECRHKLGEAVSGSVAVTQGGAVPPGCIALQCRRCGTEYVVCPADRLKLAA